MAILTLEQRQAIAQAGGNPFRVEDPETHRAYVIVKAEVFERHEEGLTDTDETLSDPRVQTVARGEQINALSRLALAASLLLLVFGARELGHDNPDFGTP